MTGLSLTRPWTGVYGFLRVAALLLPTGIVGLSGAGCTTNVVVSEDFPGPIAEKVPIDVGVHYDEGFKNYAYEPVGLRWTVQVGAAQVALFDRVFAAMFERVITVAAPGIQGWSEPGMAGVIEPLVEDYRFLTSWQSGAEFYQVWIRYRMRLYLPDGRLVANWRFTAYGRSPSQGLKRADPLNQATAAALRDAAAAMIVEFPAEADVNQWFTEMNTGGRFSEENN